MRRRNTPRDESDENAALFDTADGIDERQFQRPRSRIPFKFILYIMVFLIAGVVCITFSVLIFTGHIEEKYSDRLWPLFILGNILLIPGGYYGYILFCILFGIRNYTIDDIPML